MDPNERPTGYVSIHERRLEMMERTIWSRPAGRKGSGDLGGDFETVEIGSIPGLIAGFVGLAIQGVSAAFPYLLAAWIAPVWFLGIQYVIWALGFRAALRRHDEHPWQTLAIPIVSIALWALALYVGTTELGWQPARFPTTGP